MRFIRGIALAATIALAAAAPAQAVERILRFVSDVTVERNGDLSVVETIQVQAEHNQINHGIFRDFPTTYTTPDGRDVVVGFDPLSVTLDGKPQPWTTEGMSNGVRVRIGSADTTVSIGPHEYVIHYRTTRQLGYFPDYDELYWNVTGNGWPFAIDLAEARITLPQAVPFRQTAFYTGLQGATERAASIVTQEPGHIVFRTTRPLPAYNGLTVAAGWQKGVVDPPSTAQKTTWWIQDNLATVIGAGGLLLLVTYYMLAWMRVGRDPPRGTIIPLFVPPEGMSAAAVRFAERMAFDARCFTAAIVDLGVNGHIKLSGTGANTVIASREGGKTVGAPESALENKLFAGGPSLQLIQTNYKPIQKATVALKEGLNAAYDGKLFTDNFGWSGFGMLLVAVVIGSMAVALGATYGPSRFGSLELGLLMPILPIVLGALLIRAGLRRDSWGLAMIIAGAAIIVAVAGVGLVMMSDGGSAPLDAVPGVAAYVLALFGFLGFHWLQAPTVEGRAVMDRIEGFRQYLGTAEEDRLNALNPPDKTPELFERFLPYAIALDVENRWAKRFAAVLAAAGTAQVASTWYTGNRWSNDPVGFTNHLTGALASTISSAGSPPGSTGGGGGSSGGGSSGGGGGGGGGGGW